MKHLHQYKDHTWSLTWSFAELSANDVVYRQRQHVDGHDTPDDQCRHFSHSRVIFQLSNTDVKLMMLQLLTTGCCCCCCCYKWLTIDGASVTPRAVRDVTNRLQSQTRKWRELRRLRYRPRMWLSSAMGSSVTSGDQCVSHGSVVLDSQN